MNSEKLGIFFIFERKGDHEAYKIINGPGKVDWRLLALLLREGEQKRMCETERWKI